MDIVFKKLPLYQAVTCDEATAFAILEELRRQDFQDWQREVAECWILQGNWQYKSPKKLTVKDFFPSEKEIAGFDAFMSVEVVQAKLRELGNYYKQQYVASIRAEIEEKNLKEYVNLRKNYLSLWKKIVSLQFDNSTLQDEIITLKNLLETAKNRISNLEERLKND